MSSDDDDALVVSNVAVEATQFSGPLPPPEWLRQYNEVLPGIADRMMTIVERDVANNHATAQHRRDREQEVVSAGITLAKRGQVTAAMLALAFLAASVILVIAGYGFLGGAIGITDLIATFASFIYSLRRSQGDRKRTED